MGIEIVTIVNSSGKIISNGGKLLNVFKEAKASYDEKKASIRAEQAVKRSQTFDVRTVPQYQEEAFVNHEYEYGHGQVRHGRYQDDAASQASSRRSFGSRRSKSVRQRSQSQTRPALTMDNLKTHSEISSVAPSRRPPVAYRSPYAETSRELTLSRPSLAPARSYAPSVHRDTGQAAQYYDEYEQYPPQHVPMQRSRSDPAVGDGSNYPKKKKSIDMNLAYGNIPPDLADRVDLDPAYQAMEKERKAQALVTRVEQMLVEANCIHHSAQHTIKHLQENPDAAASVALTLAELSAIVGKMSPAFLAALKGGSPAIFALLASPQFMIAAGVAVGVTVVMFGGWKIVKRVQEQQAAAALPAPMPMAIESDHQPVRAPYPITESQPYDEALVLEEELSTIETWRRGIAPFGENEGADLELISPEADRAIRSQYGGDDTRTERSFRTFRSSRTAKTSKTDKTEKTLRTAKASKSSASRRDDDVEIPDRKSSKGNKDADAASEAGSHRSHRSHRSEKSDRSAKTSRSKRTLAIEDGSKDKENTIEAVLRPKKDSLLKNMFRKKTDASREKSHSISGMKIN